MGQPIKTVSIPAPNFYATDDLYGLLTGVAWDLSSPGATLTYSFPATASQYGTDYNQWTLKETDYFTQFSNAQRTIVRGVLASYQAVSGITFQELTGSKAGNATLRIAEVNSSTTGLGGTAWGYFPDTAGYGGDAWFADLGTETPKIGSYLYHQFLHEIGHTLGLKHGHASLSGYWLTNGTVLSNPDVLSSSFDSMEYSVMTYRGYVNASTTLGYSNEDYGFAQSLMMLDIQAIQFLYGANFNTNSDDTVYSFDPNSGEMFVNGKGQGQPGANRIFRTIWDGGGKDTYDLSNYKTDLTINLAPGASSVFSKAQLAELNYYEVVDHGAVPIYASGNLYNALQYQGDSRSLIENAFGGSGNDTIYGNAADNYLKGNGGDDLMSANHNWWDQTPVGNDTFDGGDGNDTLLGYQGNDSLLGGTGDDSITGLAGNDTLFGGLGNDSLDGGAGYDCAVCQGQYANYSVTWDATLRRYVVKDNRSGTSNEGVDYLTGIEEIDFTGGGSALKLDRHGMAVGHDVSGDGVSDLVWRNTSYGEADLWTMQNGAVKVSSFLGSIPTNWSIAATGDFNGDGTVDLVWRDADTGEADLWTMSNGVATSSSVLGVIPTNWSIVGAGDVIGDGTSDLVWRDAYSGETDLWTMQNGAVIKSTVLGVIPTNWTVAAIDDFNGDGAADLIWRDAYTGEADLWTMTNGAVSKSSVLAAIPTDWSIAGTGDFNGDGIADILWRNGSTGETDLWTMSNGAVSKSSFLGLIPTNWTIAGTGDFNGDGIADILWRDTNSGEVDLWTMATNGAVAQSQVLAAVPTDWQITKV